MSNDSNTAQSESGLVVLLKAHNVSEEMALAISPAFTELFDLANEWNDKAKKYLSDPDLSPEEKAKEARTARLALVKVRTGIEKKRKELNEEDQKRIADRNTIGKVLTSLVVPTEALLQEEEDRAENLLKAEKDKIKNERLEKIKPYEVDCTFFDLANMPEEAFSTLLENSRLAFEKRADEIALNERTAKRKEQLISLGFKPDESGNYVHEYSVMGQKIAYDKEAFVMFNEDHWIDVLNTFTICINTISKKRAEEKQAQENKLKAEKDEADRKLALLQQEQKEKEQKHQEALFRQGMFQEMGIALEYQKAIEMTDLEYATLFEQKKLEYGAEQNRIFIEQKKKEREDFLKKQTEEEEARKKRELELAPDKQKLLNFINNFEFETYGIVSEDAEKTEKDIHQKFLAFKKWAIEQINLLK